MKRRIVSVGLVIFAIWPALQYAMVLHYDVDPWRLFGFAMYCVPGSMKTVRVVQVAHDGSQRALDPWGYDEEDQRVVDRFRVRRQALGRLASGDALAAYMLARHPDWEGVALPVLSVRLDRRTARTRVDVEQATWWRDGSRETVEVPVSSFVTSP